MRARSLSLYGVLSLILGTMGTLALVFALASGEIHQQHAFESQRISMRDLVRIKTADILDQLAEMERKLGLALQRDTTFREAVKNLDATAVQGQLYNEFHRFFVTTGKVKLEKLVVLDRDLSVIADQTEVSSFLKPGEMNCRNIIDAARPRTGASRMQMISGLCTDTGRPNHATLLPIGAPRLLGYLLVITEPAHNLLATESALGMPMRIQFPDGSERYRSENWPNEDSAPTTLTATYTLRVGGSTPIMDISVADQVRPLFPNMPDTRLVVMVGATLITATVIALAIVLLRRTTIKPLETLTRQLHLLREDREQLGKEITISGTHEIRELGRNFNDMTSELAKLYRTLQGMSDVLTRTTDGYLSLDTHGIIRYINPQACRYLEVDGAEVAESPFDKVLPHLQAAFHSTLDTATETGTGQSAEQYYTPLDKWLQLHCYPDKDGMKIHFRDVTQQKVAEQASLEKLQAESASEAKSAIIASVSHEIRTPLTGIIGFAETLLDNPQQPAEQRMKAVQTIAGNGKHLLSIINDLLDLSKIEAGQMTVERIPTDLLKLIGEVEDIASIQAVQNGLELDIQYHWPLPETIETDPLRVKQILLNLCSNAVKFTERGYVRLEVRCNRETGELLVNVADTGIGMDEQTLQRVFEQFSQAEASTARRYGGTGLGLPISKQLAELLDGSLTAESLPGLGTCFRLRVATGELSNTNWLNRPQQAAGQSSRRKADQIPSLSGHILLAEDNPVNQELIKLLITQTGCTVDVVGNGLEALKTASRGDYDLVLMDMQMPVMDGLEATERLRAEGYSGSIAALTANNMVEDRDRYIAAGCDVFLSKPVDRPAFYEALTEFTRPGPSSQAAGSSSSA